MSTHHPISSYFTRPCVSLSSTGRSNSNFHSHSHSNSSLGSSPPVPLFDRGEVIIDDQLAVLGTSSSNSLGQLGRSDSIGSVGCVPLSQRANSGAFLTFSQSFGSDYLTPSDQPILARSDADMKEDLINARQPNKKSKVVVPHEVPFSMANQFAAVKGISLQQSSATSMSSTSVSSMSSSGLDNLQTLSTSLPVSSSIHHLPSMTNPFLSSTCANTSSAISPSSASSSSSGSSLPSRKRNITVAPYSALSYADRFNKDFIYLRKIGSGSFGDVIRVTSRLDGVDYAIKKRRKKLCGQLKDALKEVFALAFLNQRNSPPSALLKYFGAWIEEDMIYIQTELCTGGPLSKRLQQNTHGTQTQMRGSISENSNSMMAKDEMDDKENQLNLETENSLSSTDAKGTSVSDTSSSSNYGFSTEEVAEIAIQLAKGLAFMHDQCQVAHLDIKPENILETGDGSYKICDYGLVCALSAGASALHEVGDKRYLPVEAMSDRVSRLDKLDMYAYGVTLYELASGSVCSAEHRNRISSGDIDDIAHKVSTKLLQIIRSVLNPDPNLRMSAAEVVAELEDSSNPLAPLNEQLNGELQAMQALIGTQQAEIQRLQNLLQQYQQQQQQQQTQKSHSPHQHHQQQPPVNVLKSSHMHTLAHGHRSLSAIASSSMSSSLFGVYAAGLNLGRRLDDVR